MKDMIILRERVITIKAGDTFDQALQGNVLRVTKGAVPLRIQDREGQLDFTLEAGERAKFPDDINGLILSHTNGADQSFTVQVGKGVEIASAQVSGSVSITGTPTVINGGGTLTSISNTVKTADDGITYGASYKTVANMGAASSIVVFSPAANTNGAIIHVADVYSFVTSGSNPCVALISKSSAPSSITDGDVLMMFCGFNGFSASPMRMEKAIRLPAGRGLYFYSISAESNGARQVLYTLL